MCVKVRRRVGLVLMATSVLAAVIIQLVSDAFVQVSTVREDKPPSGALPTKVMLLVNVHWGYGLPLAACFCCGLICLVWPSRKPPRLASWSGHLGSQQQHPPLPASRQL